MSKVVLKVMAGLTFSMLLFLFAVPVNNANAFCIYNHNVHSTSGYGNIKVVQKSGHKFGRGYVATISKGDRGCVHWSNTSVNTSGKRDSTLRFDVYYLFPPKSEVKICDNFPIKAGGWMNVKHEPGWQWSDPRICVDFF